MSKPSKSKSKSKAAVEEQPAASESEKKGILDVELAASADEPQAESNTEECVICMLPINEVKGSLVCVSICYLLILYFLVFKYSIIIRFFFRSCIHFVLHALNRGLKLRTHVRFARQGSNISIKRSKSL